MNFYSHAKAGLLAASIMGGVAAFVNKDLQTAVYSFTLTFCGSIFPDLDTESIPSRWAARAGLLFTSACIFLDNLFPAAIAGMLFFAIKSGHHRGFTHKYPLPVICILLSFYLGFWDSMLYASFGIGLICHLMLDNLRLLDSRNWI